MRFPVKSLPLPSRMTDWFTSSSHSGNRVMPGRMDKMIGKWWEQNNENLDSAQLMTLGFGPHVSLAIMDSRRAVHSAFKASIYLRDQHWFGEKCHLSSIFFRRTRSLADNFRMQWLASRSDRGILWLPEKNSAGGKSNWRGSSLFSTGFGEPYDLSQTKKSNSWPRLENCRFSSCPSKARALSDRSQNRMLGTKWRFTKTISIDKGGRTLPSWQKSGRISGNAEGWIWMLYHRFFNSLQVVLTRIEWNRALLSVLITLKKIHMT
jgi:hypothetical protein